MSVATLQQQRIINEIHLELDRALVKHGPFESRAVGLAGIVEEVGELAKGLLEGEDDASLRQEVIQIGAMAVRFITDCVPYNLTGGNQD